VLGQQQRDLDLLAAAAPTGSCTAASTAAGGDGKAEAERRHGARDDPRSNAHLVS
jgi:hypothetical protein